MYLCTKNKKMMKKHLEELHQLGVFHKRDVLSFIKRRYCNQSDGFLKMPRLSVDVDLDFSKPCSREWRLLIKKNCLLIDSISGSINRNYYLTLKLLLSASKTIRWLCGKRKKRIRPPEIVF